MKEEKNNKDYVRRLSHRFIHTRVRSVKRRINSTLGFAVNNRLKASTLVQFWKTRKRVNQGKTQCWALFVISKATLTKTAIKPKFFKNFQCYNRSVLYKASEFGVHWKFRINLFKSKRFKDRRCQPRPQGFSLKKWVGRGWDGVPTKRLGRATLILEYTERDRFRFFH